MDQLNLQKHQHQKFFNSFIQQNGTALDNSNISTAPMAADDTANKLSMIDQISKQIDSISEVNSFEKKKKLKIKNPKLIQKHKVNDKEIKPKKKDKAYRCCGDLGCSSGMDQPELPMCLRGSSDEQQHLASLFNTLIHHKKCRRTRTVFTDMQLIGLEKRFESQKYLSTPDRIQLADFLGLSQLQVKTWYQNRRMKWKKKVLKDGSKNAPTKPKGRPKKNSIPSLSDILKAAAEEKLDTTGSVMGSFGLKNSSIDDSRSSCSEEDDDEIELSDDDEDEELFDVEDTEDEEVNEKSMEFSKIEHDSAMLT